jgi:hypothetical protein
VKVVVGLGRPHGERKAKNSVGDVMPSSSGSSIFDYGQDGRCWWFESARIFRYHKQVRSKGSGCK